MVNDVAFDTTIERIIQNEALRQAVEDCFICSMGIIPVVSKTTDRKELYKEWTAEFKKMFLFEKELTEFFEKNK